MCRAVSLLVGAVCAACLLAPVKAHTEIVERPDTPLVSVLDIGPNWVKVQAYLGHGLDYFDSREQDYVNQAAALGDYVCTLNDRRGILLSQLSEGTMLEPRIYYLIACALP